MTFENSLIKKYWPAEDKNADGDLLPQLHIQIEAELENSLQVGHLFTSMVKGLVTIDFTHRETGERVTLPAATIKPFNVKQKKVKIGKGEDAAFVMVEYAQMSVITQLDEEGELMKRLYSIFNRPVVMDVVDFNTEPVDVPNSPASAVEKAPVNSSPQPGA